ncbi:FeoB-associated Cys-rich membrane protein [Fusibacter ferrireducens]|uniref:FeoB-associated Cys-rich membrane protein n=1 Tax=Fusibacter ferrireducens TaxID=2785058 RepID=A0ABR9ZZ94_9FIRM|nr:FeoB-associated Cys-rich membrane protein [Fusibacter ferrireducens]MBF4695220.1 FeoB-associated Cys-rich membrane protein [Fusibacter ferrireducens]
MGTVVTLVIGILIALYAFTIIRKSVKQVKAGKCMSCSVKSEDCHCHEVHDIIDLEEGGRNDKKN